ncbi:LysR family transcriptional regulator [Phenylobacterium sp.]|uniref:LysR family transcriptional regulator n=1 Tax=Phenylobacterium sp. TaxID=1871053 RepID=UPI002DE44955|nr:LysR family transcriptional regulator [Phenylobacterium sp.]
MELRHLEQILAICRAGGFSSAARSLRVSQPTLSKSIARLEGKLAVKLFDRSAGAAKPTAYGRFIAERAEGLLNGVASLERDLEQLTHGEAGRLRIGVGPVPRLAILPGLVQHMAERFPTLKLETEQDKAQSLLRGLEEGRYDVVFVTFEATEPFGDLMRVKVVEDDHVAVARPGHAALQEAQPLSARQLMAYPMATARLVPSFRRWAGDLTEAERANLQAFVSDDFDLIKQRVMATPLLTIGPRLIFQPELAQGRLVELPITWDTPYECWMLTTADRWRSPVVKAAAEAAKAAAA